MDVLFFIFLVCLFWAPESAADQVSIVFSTAPLLSGSSLTACMPVNASTCYGGLASVVAYVRFWQLQGQRVVFLPKVDFTSTFVQMYQSQWSVNIQIFQYFGFNNYWGSPGLFTDNRVTNDGLLQSNVTLTMANAYLPPSQKWYGYTVQSYYYERVVIIPLADQTQPYCADVVSAVNEAVADAWRRWGGRLDLTVVLHRSASNLDAFATAVEQMTHSPDIVLFEDPPANFQAGLRNRTLFVRFEQSDANLTRLLVNYTVGGSRAQVQATQVDGVALATLPAAYKTAQFYADEAYLQSLASAAQAYDPTLGTSAAAMPVTRLSGSGTNACMAGECPLGDLFTDANMWKSNTDLAITTSGGLRGPGWAAGPIKVSDIWAAMPFVDNLCHATVLGVTLFDIFNYSTALATFSASTSGTADRLLQVNGVRVTYNPALSPIGGRLIALEVWNKTTLQYVPLERLRLYTLAADSFFCESFDVFPTYVSARYTGEVAAKVSDTTLQDLLGMYLQANSPITPGTSGRLVSSTATTPMAWRQTLETCPTNTMWKASIGTCVPCPDGLYQPATGQSSCVVKPLLVQVGSTSIVAPVVGGCVGGAGGLVLLLLLLLCCRKRGVRDIANAPKKGKVTLLFTDIQDSTKLWGAAPESMARALDDHHSLIRDCIRRHRGYEVKTVGDSFMIAVGSPEAGVNIAMDIQLALQQQPFPAAIEEVYAGEEDVLDDPDRLAQLHPLWNGLRVRIGVHAGEPDCVFDTVTKGYDYYGPAVNVAARVESVARGGQVLVSEAVYEAMAFDPEKVDTHCIGPTPLKGVAQPVVLYHVLPQALVERSNAFVTEKLILVSGADKEDDAPDATSDTGTTIGDSTMADRIQTHPLVRQNVMTAEQAERAVQDISQTLLAVLRLVPKKAADGMVGALAQAWRTKAGRAREDTLQMVALRALPTIPRYRQLAGPGNGSRQATATFSELTPRPADREPSLRVQEVGSPCPNPAGDTRVADWPRHLNTPLEEV